MAITKKRGIIYSKNKTPKFQAGSTFSSENFQYGDSKLFGDSGGSSFGNQTSRAVGFGGKGQAPSFGKQFNPNSFKSWENKISPTIAASAPSRDFGYEALNNAGKGLTSNSVLTTPSILTKPAMPSIKGADSNKAGKFDAEGAIGAITPLIGAAGAALSATTDNDPTTFTKKEKRGAIGGSMLKGMSTGASLGTFIPVPILGTLAGAAVGAIIGGLFGRGKAKKLQGEADKARKQKDIKLASAESAKRRAEASEKDASLAATPMTTANTVDSASLGYLSRKNGGSFHYTMKKSTSANRLVILDLTPKSTKKFKRGGKISASENIIPNGVLHEEFNKLGDKGMPVVKCKNNSCEKKYEIERDELIFTLEATKNVEKLVKSGDLKKLGQYVKSQLLDNTHSFTEKFDELNTYNKTKNESIFA